MRKLLFIACLLCGLLSCSPEARLRDRIVGMWLLRKVEVVTDGRREPAAVPEYYWEFRDDGALLRDGSVSSWKYRKATPAELVVRYPEKATEYVYQVIFLNDEKMILQSREVGPWDYLQYEFERFI